MSGIYGIINLDNQPVHQEHLDKMSKSLKHRAVDGQNIYLKDNVGLGHALMCLSPESKYERQPLQYKQWIIVLDGRLFNRDVLLKQFNISPAEYCTTPDSVLVIKAYERWKEDCSEYLLGEFAVLIWDTQAQSIYASKDRFGNRSFYYYWNEQQFYFASELKALLDLPLISKEIDVRKLLFLFTFPLIGAGEGTHFNSISNLPRAHYLLIRAGEKHLKRYWEPTFKGYLQLPSDKAYADSLLEVMEQSINDRIRIDGASGVALSGGLDSSAVACIAARQLNQKNKSLYASGFLPPPERNGTIGDEREYMEAVDKQEKNIVFQPVTVSPPTPEFIQHFHQSYALPHHFGSTSWHKVFKKLEQNDVRVLLTGFLGDDIISRKGKLVIKNLIHDKNWKSLFQVLKKRKDYTKQSILKIILKEVIRGYIPAQLETVMQSFKGKKNSISHFDLHTSLFLPSFASAKELTNDLDSISRLLNVSNIHLQLENILTHSSDMFSSGVSIPAHHHQMIFSNPLADVRIVDWAMSLPPEKWLLNGIPRGLIREATKGILPELVRNRMTKGYIMEEECFFFQNQIEHYISDIKRIDNKIWVYINKDELIRHLEYYQKNNNDTIFRVSDNIIQLFNFINHF